VPILTNVVSYLLIGSFLVLQRVLRRGEQARSLRPNQADKGTTRLIVMAFGFSFLALILAPLLNRFEVAHLDLDFPVGWVGVALMLGGLALRWWANAVLGRFYTSTLRLAEDQQIVKGEPALSDLLWRWRALNGSVASDSELLALNRRLVRFLFSHRDCDVTLGVWLKSIQEACLEEAFSREPLLSDEETRFNNLMALCEDGKKLAAWSVPQFGGQGGTPDHLNLMTLHSAKGLEFDVVFMLGMDQGIIPGWGHTTPSSKREPRRLFYVGLTRARYEVHMLYSGWRDSPYGRKHDGPSEFLLEVKKAVEIN
jgi:hypothetical protein